jgi:acetylornithine/succinyldiaminopimelate/putrescine aminotransferase
MCAAGADVGGKPDVGEKPQMGGKPDMGEKPQMGGMAEMAGKPDVAGKPETGGTKEEEASPVLPFRDLESCFQAFETYVDPGKARFFRQLGLSIVMGRRSGAWFQDAYSGVRYYNCHCNGGVFNLGHRNAAIERALRKALSYLDIGNHHLISPYRAALARRLAESTGGILAGAIFTPGGGEAIDLAIKLARGVTGRQKIVSIEGSYHGHTGLAMAAGDARYRDAFGPNLPGFVQVPFNDVEAMLSAVDEETAAVLLEPIPATLGMPMPEPGYLQEVEKICREAGALFGVDEVQTGLGRTGTVWCFQQEGVRPDLLVTGKGLSGGYYPMAATLVSQKVMEWLAEHPFVHISSYGGSELGCVVGMAVLDIVESDGFLEGVKRRGEQFAQAFEDLDFELRRKGMMMALKLEREGDGIAAAAKLIREGVFAVYANNDTSCVQFLPPLILDDDDFEVIVDRVRKALG